MLENFDFEGLVEYFNKKVPNCPVSDKFIEFAVKCYVEDSGLVEDRETIIAIKNTIKDMIFDKADNNMHKLIATQG